MKGRGFCNQVFRNRNDAQIWNLSALFVGEHKLKFGRQRWLGEFVYGVSVVESVLLSSVQWQLIGSKYKYKITRRNSSVFL